MHGGSAMPFPEHIPLRPSRALCVALGVIHAVAAACLLPLTVAIAVKLAVAAALLGSLVATMRGSVLLRAPGSITGLTLYEDGTLEVWRRDGRRQAVTVTAQTAVFSFLAAITFRIPGERRTQSQLILPDMAGPAEFRRLRVWLRWRTAVVPFPDHL